MSRNTIYIILTLLKVVILIIGLVKVNVNIFEWRRTKDRQKLKDAAIIFGAVFLAIMILTIIEFAIAFNWTRLYSKHV